MERRVLGRTGLWVSKLGLGTGQFGAFGQTTKSECVRVAHVAFDGGITLVDTADFIRWDKPRPSPARPSPGGAKSW